MLGRAAAQVVALARAGKIIDNSYHCFNREFTTGLRAHKKAIVAAQAKPPLTRTRTRARTRARTRTRTLTLGLVLGLGSTL